MDDVKDQATEVQPQAEETAEQSSQPAEQTPEAPEVSVEETPQERMVPLKVLQEERKRRQEAERKAAEREASSKLSQYDPADIDQVLNHPLVQDLIIKQARQELTDYARETLDQYPTLHPQVKKAILKNVRGFVSETTSDVETAKVDLLGYIEEIAEDNAAEPTQLPSKQGFKVASTNVPTTESSALNTKQIEEILAKPVDELTDEDSAILADYQKRRKI